MFLFTVLMFSHQKWNNIKLLFLTRELLEGITARMKPILIQNFEAHS